jgi:hypothetical protein
MHFAPGKGNAQTGFFDLQFDILHLVPVDIPVVVG